MFHGAVCITGSCCVSVAVPVSVSSSVPGSSVICVSVIFSVEEGKADDVAAGEEHPVSKNPAIRIGNIHFFIRFQTPLSQEYPPCDRLHP